MAKPTTTKRPRILIAEDHVTVREGLAAIFSHFCDVVEVGTGQEALIEFKNGEFDVVTLDLRMPGMDGLDCLAAIRTVDLRVPVIILTTFDTPEDVRRAFLLGATDFFCKDAGCATLVNAVKAALAKSQTRVAPTLNRSEAPGPKASAIEGIFTDTTAAFIHKLNNQFLALSEISKNIRTTTKAATGKWRRRLLRLTNDLATGIDSTRYVLQRFRNTMGRNPGVLRRLDLNKVLLDVQHHLRAQDAPQIILRLPRRECEVVGDYELLWHLFENLVRNAVEATQGLERGCVTVKAQTDLRMKMVHISVHDNGPGIAPEFLPRIFDLDFTTKPGGLGVGLYIAKRAVAIHNGSIECKSDATRGTEFTILLPLAQSEKP